MSRQGRIISQKGHIVPPPPLGSRIWVAASGWPLLTPPAPVTVATDGGGAACGVGGGGCEGVGGGAPERALSMQASRPAASWKVQPWKTAVRAGDLHGEFVFRVHLSSQDDHRPHSAGCNKASGFKHGSQTVDQHTGFLCVAPPAPCNLMFLPVFAVSRALRYMAASRHGECVLPEEYSGAVCASREHSPLD